MAVFIGYKAVDFVAPFKEDGKLQHHLVVQALIHQGHIYAGSDVKYRIAAYAAKDSIALGNILERHKLAHDVWVSYDDAKHNAFWVAKNLIQYADKD